MAYIGSSTSTVGNFQACDAITTSATTTFNLLVGGTCCILAHNQPNTA